ncbi:Lrp/AsnC family transcriptional regulator [Candidatus Woesearchaeota archaeon]|nr:Lrp/AsnC family transcriptional regulator [Candidatus Woesearchaeota archaeon]
MDMVKFLFDTADKKVLYALDCNARSPVSRIAKAARLSRDVVSYRLKRFDENKVILKYHAIIDLAKLGFAAHKLFIRFQNMGEQREQEFIAYVQKSPDVIYAASYDGRFDIVVSFWARTLEELAKASKELERRFGDRIADHQMVSIINGEYSTRGYLAGTKQQIRNSVFGSTPKPVALDELHTKILLILGQDARISAVEIANKLRCSADVVCQRIRKLEHAGVIQGYNLVPNEESYPYIHYKLLLSLHTMSRPEEKKLEEYCRLHQNIWYFCSTLGQWQFEIDLDVASSEEFRRLLRNIKLEFSTIIRDCSVLTVFKTHVYNFFPSIPLPKSHGEWL